MIDSQLVSCLVATQFPQFRDLPVQPVELSGWDNRTFRLGKHMLVRMPSAERYAIKVKKEQKWLPRLTSVLPLSIPLPVAMGEAGEDYPMEDGPFIAGLRAKLLHLRTHNRPRLTSQPVLHNFSSLCKALIPRTDTYQAYITSIVVDL